MLQNAQGSQRLDPIVMQVPEYGQQPMGRAVR